MSRAEAANESWAPAAESHRANFPGTVLVEGDIARHASRSQGIPEGVFHEDPPDLVFPPERTDEFTALRDRAVAETDWRAVRYLMDVPEDVFDRAVAENLGMEDPVDGMRRILSATRTYMGAGLELAAAKPDLMMVYLEGTDTIG